MPFALEGRMSSTRRLKPIDFLLTTVAIAILVAGLALISPDVRGYLAKIVSGDATEVTLLAHRAQDLTRDVIKAVNEYRANNVPMVGFGVVAVVLAFLMFRT